jgi:3-dehydroquinate dehydratase type I
MICVAISEPDINKCLQILDRVEMAEIRLDLTGFTTSEITKAFSHPTTTIATCRPGTKGDIDQFMKLKAAMEAGAKYVDIEIDAGKKQLEEVIAVARKCKCKIIVSYHNFEETPGLHELHRIADTCYESGADIAKIATMIRSTADNARILSLYSIQKPMVALGMGPMGKITRIMSPLLGAEFTFASTEEGAPTAPGQINYTKLKEIIYRIEKELKEEV